MINLSGKMVATIERNTLELWRDPNGFMYGTEIDFDGNPTGAFDLNSDNLPWIIEQVRDEVSDDLILELTSILLSDMLAEKGFSGCEASKIKSALSIEDVTTDKQTKRWVTVANQKPGETDRAPYIVLKALDKTAKGTIPSEEYKCYYSL